MSADPSEGSLYQVFSEIPDPRHRRGTVYPLASVLTLVATARLCGCRSLAAIAQWGHDYNHLAPALGFSRRTEDGARYRTPCTSALHTLRAALPAPVFEAALTRWILAQGATDLGARVVAIDGKTLRGSQGHQLPGVHLLAASCRDVEAVLAQLAVPGKTNEHKTALELLKLIPPEGDADHRRCGVHAAGPLRGGGPGPGGLLPDGQGEPAGAGGGHPGGVRPGVFPPGRRSDGPPKTTGPRSGARATVGLRPAASGPPRGWRGTSTGPGSSRSACWSGCGGRRASGPPRRSARSPASAPTGPRQSDCWRSRGGIGTSRTGCTGSVT